MTGHQGFSRKRIAGQHVGQTVPGRLTMRRQDGQVGGNRSRDAASPAILPMRLSVSLLCVISADSRRELRHEHQKLYPGAMANQDLFDDKAVIRNRNRAGQSADAPRFLYDIALQDLALRLSAVDRNFENAVSYGCPDRSAADALVSAGKAASAVHVPYGGFVDAIADPTHALEGAKDADLAVSLFALQSINDLPGALVRIRQALRPDGLMIAALLGGGTLQELRASLIAAETTLSGGARPRVAPFTDIRDAGSLLQRTGYALPVTDLENYTVRYDSLFDLMRDLKAMGMANPLSARTKAFSTRALFVEAARHYAENFADPDGRIRATFNILWMSGWAPAPSQPKPLKPGTGRVSLKDVLE